jgi:hypothetical protein
MPTTTREMTRRLALLAQNGVEIVKFNRFAPVLSGNLSVTAWFATRRRLRPLGLGPGQPSLDEALAAERHEKPARGGFRGDAGRRGVSPWSRSLRGVTSH